MTTAHPILKWYSGKWRTEIETIILPMFLAAVERGFWLPKEETKIKAAFNKQAVAKTWANTQERKDDRMLKNEGLLVDICDDRECPWRSELRGWSLMHAMMFGAVSHAPSCLALADKLVEFCKNEKEQKALAHAKSWAEDFAPIAADLKLLDASKPRPTIVLGSLSPLVAENLGKALGIDFDTIQLPEIVWEVAMTKEDGHLIRYSMPRIRWPEGTKHNQSRFATDGNHCHACGHLIRNPFNWLPLLAMTKEGPVSLWVGHDCGKRLFEVDVRGGKAEFKKE